MAQAGRPRAPAAPAAVTPRGASATPTVVTVNAYSERWLRQGFPWVYPAELTGARPRAGSWVAIRGAQGADLGAGVADDGWISVRRFVAEVAPLSGDLLAERLAAAAARRQAVVDVNTTAWRWVNAENDDMPGIRVDVYGADLVLTVDSASLELLLPELVGALRRGPPGIASFEAVRSIHLAWRPDPRDHNLRAPTRAGTCIWGEAPDEVEVKERGIRVWVRPGAGKDIGLYTDMRDNRRWLESYWRGRRLLNLFGHTGMFSVSAAAHGARETVTVDLSGPALDVARRNFELNQLDLGPHSFVEADVFKVLDRFRRQGRRFDVVLADPPGFSHGEQGLWSGENDYPRLVAACLSVLEPGGWLVAASNLGSVSPKQFQGHLADGARRAGRSLRLLHEGGAAPDHPAALAFPEGRYLKLWVMAA